MSLRTFALLSLWPALVAAQPALRWGGDQEGGGPYILADAKSGFEVDLIAALAERIGRPPQFQQNEWDKLPDLLRRRGIDVICNGYELTRPHCESMRPSLPYYAYELVCLGRADGSLNDWDDLKKPRDGVRRKVGVLGGTVAENYCRERFGVAVEIVTYPGTTQAMEHVQLGQLDATVTDTPPALYYRSRYPSLKQLGAPTARGLYVLYFHPADVALRDQVDAALLATMRDGTLRSIYEKYGIWTPAQNEHFFTLGAGTDGGRNGPGDPGETSASALHGWGVARARLFLFLEAAARTVLLSVLSMPLAIIIGLLVALGRLYGPGWLRMPLAGYVELLRGTPLLLQLFVIFYVLPAWGIRIDAIPAAVLGLAINYSAYESEIYRAGLLAIPAGQMEAALALGLSRRQALRYVVVPQAVRLVIPPVTNDFINLFKDTSVCSAITVVELTKRYSIDSNGTGAFVELAVLTALLYLVMSYPLAILSRRLERGQRAVVA